MTPAMAKREIHIAPMLHVSSREFRQFLRILSRRVILWTEMVVDELLFHNVGHPDVLDSYLDFHENEHPVICQLGGILPEQLGAATEMSTLRGYDEINLNVGCPSDRVSGKRQFGAVLMKQSERCRHLVEAMSANVNSVTDDTKCRISVKCRLGVDDMDSFDELADFIDTLRPHCRIFYLHARKCLLQKLNPSQNRSVPPLNYPRIYAVCARFPDCTFFLNGGIVSLEQVSAIFAGKHETDDAIDSHGVPCKVCGFENGSCIRPPMGIPENLRGVMLGRAATQNVGMFGNVDQLFYQEPNPCASRREALEQYCHFLDDIYPRRCADQDPRRSTVHYPLVKVEPQGCCRVCLEFHPEERLYTDTAATGKLSSRILDRCLKPINSLFFGFPGQREYRRQLDKGMRSMANCGPASIIRMAMGCIADEHLDKGFETEGVLRGE